MTQGQKDSCCVVFLMSSDLTSEREDFEESSRRARKRVGCLSDLIL